MKRSEFVTMLSMRIEELVGQRLVIGIPGTRTTPEIVRHFQELHAGGLILYRINFDSPQQVKTLITDLEEALGRTLLVTVDHEGGRVIMFRDGITVFPDNLALGTAGNVDYARQHGLRTLLAEAPVGNPILLVYLKAGFRVSGFIDTYYPPGREGPVTALFLAQDLE